MGRKSNTSVSTSSNRAVISSEMNSLSRNIKKFNLNFQNLPFTELEVIRSEKVSLKYIVKEPYTER